MGSLAGKSPSNTFKSLLKVADETNGVSTTTSQIEDGEGTSTCVSIGDDNLQIAPQNDNTTTTFRVRDTSGNALLAVDTTNSCVKVNATQTYANTQLLEFTAYRIVPVAGRHYFVPCGGNSFAGHLAELDNGAGTDPDTSLDAGTSTDELVNMLFYVPANITIDGVRFMVSTDTDTDTTINVHLYSYRLANSGGTSDGNIDQGALLANGQATSVDRNVIKTVTCSIDSADVTSGKVLACFVENETNTDDINIRVQVLYHIN